jgi:hypothetical protein
MIIKGNLSNNPNAKQITVNPIWDNLTLSILTNNLDKDIWGWGDNQSIRLLDYWHRVDPKMAFVLVYNTPENFIKYLIKNTKGELSKKEFENLLNEWEEFNEMILHFYYQYPEQTFIINDSQIQKAKDNEIKTFIQRLGLTPSGTKTNLSDMQQTENDALLNYLANQIIKERYDHLSNYHELQTIAHLPHHTDNQNTLSLWQAVNMAKKHISNSDNLQSSKFKKLQEHLFKTQEELERFYLENKEKKQEIRKLQAQLSLIESQAKIVPKKDERCYKHHLRYKVGTVVAQKSKSPIGILLLPLFILREVKKHKASKKQPVTQKKPCSKHSLRYKVGSLIAEEGKSPLGLLLMPFLIHIEVKRHRKAKAEGNK